MPAAPSAPVTPRQRTAALIGGGIGLISVLLLRFATTSPWIVLHRLNAGCVLPPLWLLSCLWIACFVLLGAAAGVILSTDAGGAAETAAWRGCTFLVLSVMLTFAWYTLLFAKFSLFVSWLCLPVGLVLAVLCGISWWQVRPAASLVAFGYALWLLLIFFWQIAVLVHA